MQRLKNIVIFVLLLSPSIKPLYATESLIELDDVEAIVHIRKSLEKMEAYMHQRPDLFLTENVN